MTPTASKPRQVPALACAVLLSCATGAWTQEVSVATLQNVPADMIEPAPAAQPGAIDLGQSLTATGTAGTGAGAATGAASRAASAARKSDTRTRRPPATAASARAGIERAVFERQPIAVPLPVGRERLITLPAPAALHVPSDMARVAVNYNNFCDYTIIYTTERLPHSPSRRLKKQPSRDFLQLLSKGPLACHTGISTSPASRVPVQHCGNTSDGHSGNGFNSGNKNSKSI